MLSAFINRWELKYASFNELRGRKGDPPCERGTMDPKTLQQPATPSLSRSLIPTPPTPHPPRPARPETIGICTLALAHSIGAPILALCPPPSFLPPPISPLCTKAKPYLSPPSLLNPPFYPPPPVVQLPRGTHARTADRPTRGGCVCVKFGRESPTVGTGTDRQTDSVVFCFRWDGGRLGEGGREGDGQRTTPPPPRPNDWHCQTWGNTPRRPPPFGEQSVQNSSPSSKQKHKRMCQER